METSRSKLVRVNVDFKYGYFFKAILEPGIAQLVQRLICELDDGGIWVQVWK
jgi:hypothetical protein